MMITGTTKGVISLNHEDKVFTAFDNMCVSLNGEMTVKEVKLFLMNIYSVE